MATLAMNCSPSQPAVLSAAHPTAPAPRTAGLVANPALRRAEALLGRHGRSAGEVPGLVPGDPIQLQAACATALMDLFRRSGDSEVFEALAELVGPQLLARVRSRLRSLGLSLDPQEVVQDAMVNIYRYPDRFDACRPGAFAAWSTTIVDNAVRRRLRRRSTVVEVALSPTEVLCQHADLQAREPSLLVQEREDCQLAAQALQVLLACYLAAYEQLSPRERWVLHQVEVERRRYAELAAELAIRPEALKMVVFRARRRVLERVGQLLQAAPNLAA
jgi:RNA polymerase sigma factor (sigma-70 family)